MNENKWEFNDYTVDKYIEKIKEYESQISKLEDIKNGRISEIERLFDEKVKGRKESIEKMMLSIRNYLVENNKELKETKTQKKWESVSGNFIIKKPQIKMKADNEKLMNYLKENHRDKFIQKKESLRWGDYKKLLEIRGDRVVDSQTGLVVDGVDLVETKEEYRIK